MNIFEVNNKFYEYPHATDEHEFGFVHCEFCRFNFSYSYDRDFYAPNTLKCLCKNKHRHDIGVYCNRLKNDLNLKRLKVCMEKTSFPSSYYVSTNLNEYLKSLPGERFFY